jgi:hypothetical protein
MTRNTRSVLILGAILLVGGLAALPGLLPARAVRSQSSCFTHMRMIDAAKQTWAKERHKTANDVPIWDDLTGTNRYLKEKLVCPAAGTYTLGRVGEASSCSWPNHAAAKKERQ